MKKILISAIAIAAMAVSCQVEKLDEGTAPSGQTVRITAELPDTKTVFNPEDKTVAWEENDELTVVVNSNAAYKFTKETGSNTFTTSGVELGDGENTYHVLYPYNSYVEEVDAEGFTSRNGAKTYVDVPSTAATVQNGVNSTSHIKGVMYGYTTATGSASPSVQMHQLTALLKIDVTNNHTEPIEVRSITVSTDAAGQLLSGTYYINLETGETESSGDIYTYNYTTLGVSNVTMEAGTTGTFWVSAHPFDVPQGSTLTISMETDKGVASDDRTYDRDLHFGAGTVNTASFNFENPVQTIEKLTVAEFLAKPVDASVYYELTGTVENISNDYYGNFDLTDETGSVYVYGISSAKGAGDKNVLATLGIKEGDILTLCGTRGLHNTTIEVVDAYYISHEATPYCNVTPSVLNVTAEAGTTTFNISSNEYWVVSSDNPAYTVSPEEGTGDATVTVTYPANEGTEPVEVVFTILSGSGVEKTVTLTQRVAGQVIEPTELFISEYVEGSGNNKYIEIYNPTSNTIDLSDYTLEIYSNGKTTSVSVKLEGSIESKTALVYANSSAVLYEVPKERKSGSITFNGEKGDAIALSKNGVNIDVWGIIGSTADYGKDVTMRRNPDVSGPSAEFIESQWTTYSKDDVSDLGKHTMNE